jgi:PAT family beta-lactamase induction signal transducer AmpG
MSSDAAAPRDDYRGWAGLKRAFASPAAATMLFLGFGCGLPFVLVGGTLSTWMRDERIDLASIGLVSFVGFSYVFKFLWAPLLDRYTLPWIGSRLGRRRGWLLLAQAALVIGILALARQEPAAGLEGVVLMVFLVAFAGATQDAVVDAYRIEVAPLADQAALAATYTLGYRLGLMWSGAVVLYLAELGGWAFAYSSAAALMLLPVGATLLSREPPAAAALAVREVDLAKAFWEPLHAFFGHHGVKLAVALLVFVGLYKFPDQMIGVLAGPFYLDSGFTKADIATVSKVYGVWVGVAGAFLGGAAVALFGLRRPLLVAALAVALSNLAYLLMAANPGEQWAFFATITADNLSQGFAGTVLVAFLAGLVDVRFTATQYALLVSLANLPGKVVGGFSGFIVEASSYTAFFMISAVSVVPTLLLLAWLWPRIGPKARA